MTPSVQTLLSLMTCFQSQGLKEAQNDCFFSICRKFASNRDTLEERCFMLGLSILSSQKLDENVQYPRLNITFLPQWLPVYKGPLCNLGQIDDDIKLLNESYWMVLFEAMKIQGPETQLSECLGPIRPTILQHLLSEAGIEALALRTLLNKKDGGVLLRIKTREDLEIWKTLCSPYEKAAKQNTILPQHLLGRTIQEEFFDIKKLPLKVNEIELAPELVAVLVPKGTEMDGIQEQKTYEEIIRLLPPHPAHVFLGFTPYPGCEVYPNR